MPAAAVDRRGILAATLLTVAMLAVLVGLGTWQVQRLRWKSALLADIARAEQSAGVPVSSDAPQFTKVVAVGTLRPATGLYGAAVRTLPDGPHLGADQLAVLDRVGLPPVLVDLGWVPTDQPLPQVPEGSTRIEGYVLLPEHSSVLGPSDDAAKRVFYALDPATIGPALGTADLLPLTVVVLGPAAAAGRPDPARVLPSPTNNHLQYALTWYGFALTLVVIYGLWLRKALSA